MSGGTIARCGACGRLLIHGQDCTCRTPEAPAAGEVERFPKQMVSCSPAAGPEDDLPTTSLSELDDAMGAAVLGVCLFAVILAALVFVGWFIGRTRGAW